MSVQKTKFVFVTFVGFVIFVMQRSAVTSFTASVSTANLESQN